MDRIAAELEASRSLTDLLQLARECREKHESAGLPLPPPLLRLFGQPDGSRGADHKPTITIPSIRRSHVPDGVTDDWISITAKDASPTTVALAILRGAPSPLTARELGDAVTQILTNVSSGSVYNLVSRLCVDEVLKKNDDGRLKLVDAKNAPILDTGLIWGIPDKLSKQDVAAHRREAILHILKMEKSGLQIVQLVERLNSCSWMKAPANKDLLKADTSVLCDENKIRLLGNSRKWALVHEEG